MTGVLFRRNVKNQLINVLPGEVVYSIDTNEWGLGSSSGVTWRKHELVFKNMYLNGEGIPSIDLGETGMYYFDTLNLVVYQKEANGWVEIDYPISQTVIDSTFLRKNVIPNYDDYSTVIKKDGSVKLPIGYEATSPLEVVTKKEVQRRMSVLLTNGTTQMDDGYIPVGGGVLTLNYSNTMRVVPPTTEPIVGGVLWNDNGIPRISADPISFELLVTASNVPSITSPDGTFNIIDNGNGTFSITNTTDKITSFELGDS